jgi:hypothetical protein
MATGRGAEGQSVHPEVAAASVRASLGNRNVVFRDLGDFSLALVLSITVGREISIETLTSTVNVDGHGKRACHKLSPTVGYCVSSSQNITHEAPDDLVTAGAAGP